MTAALEINRLSAGYGNVPAIRDITLSVQSGEVVALLGPNGAGKTTTLLTAAGLLRPLSGTVHVLGADVHGRHQAHKLFQRGLGFVPENRALFPSLTVEQHLKLGWASTSEREQAMYDLFPKLSALRDRRAGVLSGGEQQMLALARAVVSSPKLLLIDEMSLGLAPIIVQGLMPLVRRLADETNAAVLLVEQHVGLALQVADRGYVLVHGEIVLEESADGLRRRRHELEHRYLGGVEVVTDEEDVTNDKSPDESRSIR